MALNKLRVITIRSVTVHVSLVIIAIKYVMSIKQKTSIKGFWESGFPKWLLNGIVDAGYR